MLSKTAINFHIMYQKWTSYDYFWCFWTSISQLLHPPKYPFSWVLCNNIIIYGGRGERLSYRLGKNLKIKLLNYPLVLSRCSLGRPHWENYNGIVIIILYFSLSFAYRRIYRHPCINALIVLYKKCCSKSVVMLTLQRREVSIVDRGYIACIQYYISYNVIYGHKIIRQYI